MSRWCFAVVVDAERCKGCGLCIDFCPRGVLELSAELNRLGYHYVTAKRMEACIGCQACVIMCPDAAIELYRRQVPASHCEPKRPSS